MIELQHEKSRKQYLYDNLMIVFDVDGTIFDMYYRVFFVLKSFDKYNYFKYFYDLKIRDINKEDEDQIDQLLERLEIP